MRTKQFARLLRFVAGDPQPKGPLLFTKNFDDALEAELPSGVIIHTALACITWALIALAVLAAGGGA